MKKLSIFLIISLTFIFSVNTYAQWDTSVDIDEITDEKQVLIFTFSKEGSGDLRIATRKNGFMILVNWGDFEYTENDTVKVTYRFDKKEAKEIIGRNLSIGTTTMLFGEKDKISDETLSFLKELAISETLHIRAALMLKTVTHTFDLKGLKEEIMKADLKNTLLEKYKNEIK